MREMKHPKISGRNNHIGMNFELPDARRHFFALFNIRKRPAGEAYLDRAAPRLAPPKFLVLAFTNGLLIEPPPILNRPGGIFWPSWAAFASRFLAFCAAFAFARWRALALVMPSSPS